MADTSIVTLDFPEADVAVLSLNDPAKGANVLMRSVLATLEGYFDELLHRKDLAGLVIRSTKPGSFIAGADLREFAANIDEPTADVVKLSRAGQELFGRLARAPFVTVAAIEGVCLGGGAELSIWCDRRLMVADRRTHYGFPEVKLGLLPGWGGTARTPRVIGLSNAIELISSGEPFDPATAWAVGLVSDLVPAGPKSTDELLAAAIRMIRAERASGQYLRDRERWAGPLPLSETELAFVAATASAYIQGKTGGHYPAPLAALEAMIGGATGDVNAACAIESETFGPLWGSPVNRALLHVFFLQDGHKRAASKLAESEPRAVRTASVVGAGVMGQGIAAANAKRGIPVVLADVSLEAVSRGFAATVNEASYDRKLKGPSPTKVLEIAALVNGTIDDDEVALADFVVEAIYENGAAKRALYARLEPKLHEHAVLATNTSTIPIAELAAGLAHPERFCGLHFFNPVRKMPLVEVIRGPETSDATVATAVAYALQLGKSPVVVQDGPGFVVNRVLLPYMNEALVLLTEGATVKQIDRAAKAFGMPMGPIELYDTVGLDVALHAGEVMHAAFPDRVVQSSLLPAMVGAGRVGKKAGKGFFDYSGPKQGDAGRVSPDVETLIAAESHDAPRRRLSSEEITDRLILPMLLEATRILEDRIVTSPAELDLALIYGIGFPPFRGGLLFWADSQGAAVIVEKLKSYAPLGKRFEPTQLLLSAAAANAKLYNGIGTADGRR